MRRPFAERICAATKSAYKSCIDYQMVPSPQAHRHSMFKATSEISARNGSATHLDSLAIESRSGKPLPSPAKAVQHSQRHRSLSGLPTRASDETTGDASPVPPPKSKTVTVDMLIKWQSERRLSRKEFVKNEGVNPITFTNYTHRNWTLNDYGEDLVKLRTGYKFSPLTIALQT